MIRASAASVDAEALDRELNGGVGFTPLSTSFAPL